jgi:hypothetical protein
MKKPKKIRWISIGAKRSFEGLLAWFGDGKNKEVTKKRLIILGSVAGALTVFTVKVPAFGPVAIVLVILGVFAWWGRWPHEEMTMRYSDFAGAVQIGDVAYPSMEVLRKYIEAHPGEDAAQLARRLSEAPGSPQISPALMRGVMKELGLETSVKPEAPKKEKLSESPAEEDGPGCQEVAEGASAGPVERQDPLAKE